jgi:putative endonuclease
MDTRSKGKAGEEQAVEYLLSQGYTIVARNYQSRKGEIDCIARCEDGTLAFIEVKWARDLSRGHPFTWVTPAKQRTIVGMARQYLADHGLHTRACRFDVIAIVGGKLEHMPHAFIA